MMIFEKPLRSIASSLAGFLCVLSATAADPRIDVLLAEAHAQGGVRPTEICDDATYYRRLSLDLIGRVPTTAELQRFLAAPERAAAIDHLLASEEHPRFWSHLWTTMLVGRGNEREVEREVLRRWLEDRFHSGVNLNQLAFSLMTAEGVSSLDGPVNYVVPSRRDPVMRLSRTFLSVQLDCAQCHDHPHDRWTNDDYTAMQRFFQPMQFREVSGGVAVSDTGPDPNAEKPVFLTGRKPHTSAWRRELALMVVQSKPFSRAMVNRTWHWLMGRGIIDPVDGLSRENPPSVPALLEELAADFRADQFQLRPLIHRICSSKAYQRAPARKGPDASASSAESEQQLRLFAARTVRPQLPLQWIASVSVVLDRPIPEPDEIARQAGHLLGIGRQANPASDPFDWTSTTQTLIRQLSGEMPPPLRNLDSVFWATVAREPTSDERRLVEGQSSIDVLFALVHGNEFVMND